MTNQCTALIGFYCSWSFHTYMCFFGTFKLIWKPADLSVKLTTLQHMWERKRKERLFFFSWGFLFNGNRNKSQLLILPDMTWLLSHKSSLSFGKEPVNYLIHIPIKGGCSFHLCFLVYSCQFWNYVSTNVFLQGPSRTLAPLSDFLFVRFFLEISRSRLHTGLHNNYVCGVWGTL